MSEVVKTDFGDFQPFHKISKPTCKGIWMGRMYGTFKLCGHSSRQDPSRTAGFFINYMTPDEVQLVINEYAKGTIAVNKKNCAKKEIASLGARLMERVDTFIIRAKPYLLP